MRNEDVRKAYDIVLPDGEERARMLQNILLAASDAQPERTEIKVLKKKSIKKGAVIILAAALALALSVTVLANTTDVFGFRALQKEEPAVDNDPSPWRGKSDTKISIHPQAVPDDVYADIGTENAEEINEKLEKSRLAWNEWVEWLESIDEPMSIYEELEELEEKYGLNEWYSVEADENEDGSANFKCYTYVGENTIYAPGALRLDSTVFIPTEDYQRYLELQSYIKEDYLCDNIYYYNYTDGSDEKKAKLEETAAKYGLNVRKKMVGLTGAEYTGMTGESFHTSEEIIDILSDTVCSGRVFYETPAYISGASYYEEGTFLMSWYADIPSCGERAYCHGYNSVYTTIYGDDDNPFLAERIDYFTSRKHICPDGTEVTILFSDNRNKAYIYTYLEDSFFVMFATTEMGYEFGASDIVNYHVGDMTEEDIDAIADSINYSVIGK